jgi:hypothetical protein
MASDDEILITITDSFVQSQDFNGISVRVLSRASKTDWPILEEQLRRLILSRQIDLAFESHSVNPHIKRLPALPVEIQIEKLKDERESSICIYPSRDILRKRSELVRYDGQHYTLRLGLAEPQLSPIFFDLHVLETYFRDPRYECSFGDLQGSISVKEDHYQSKKMHARDKVLLQSFGIGYDQNRNRAVVVFLRYLADLSPNHQQIWQAHEISGPCVMNSDYERSCIWGQWPEHYSVYQVFIQEQIEINKLAILIGKPALFRNTFDEHKRPIGFSPMLRPTRHYFQEFAHILDKMLSDNLNREFFKEDIPLEDKIKAEDGSVERRPLGTITMLERWLQAHYRTGDGVDVSREVLKPFREVRKARQPAAHAINVDEYDPSYAGDQDVLLGRVMRSLISLRIIFSSHPKAKGYAPPDWLSSNKIVFY